MYVGSPAPSPPKKTNGCLIAALVVGGLVLVAGLGVGVLGWKAYSSLSPESRAGLAQELRESTAAGQRPGADALRDLGCTGASVIDTRTMPTLTRSVVGEDAGAVEDTIVECVPNVLAPEPITCPKVASAYVRAVGRAPSRFRVIVRKTHGAPITCSESRTADGRAVAQ